MTSTNPETTDHTGGASRAPLRPAETADADTPAPAAAADVPLPHPGFFDWWMLEVGAGLVALVTALWLLLDAGSGHWFSGAVSYTLLGGAGVLLTGHGVLGAWSHREVLQLSESELAEAFAREQAIELRTREVYMPRHSR